jgi:hypothetical protein
MALAVVLFDVFEVGDLLEAIDFPVEVLQITV